jgi:large subunit ribosomal protein L13
VNDWQVVDASGQVLGRLATQIATLLIGKHKPNYVPHMMSGDFVVVINAEQIKVTGLKAEKKIYKRHSQYPGNLKEISYEVMHDRHPERVIQLAVKGMLPKSKLGRQMLKRLKVYAGAEHPHSAQVLGSERREAREAAAAAKAEAESAKAEVKKPAAKKSPAKNAAPKAKAEAKAEEAPAAEAPVATEEKPAAKKQAAKKATAKKAPAKKAAAKKPAAKKPAAKKTTAKKSDDSGEK